MEVLIIDDNRADRGILDYLLTPFDGVECVIGCHNLDQAKAYLDGLKESQNQRPNLPILLFCDYKLIGKNGIEAIHEIQELYGNDRHIFSVLISGMPFDQDLSLEFPFVNEFIEKKMDINKYELSLQRIVQKARSHNTLASRLEK